MSKYVVSQAIMSEAKQVVVSVAALSSRKRSQANNDEKTATSNRDKATGFWTNVIVVACS